MEPETNKLKEINWCSGFIIDTNEYCVLPNMIHSRYWACIINASNYGLIVSGGDTSDNGELSSVEILSFFR